jgi:hypothetical protein
MSHLPVSGGQPVVPLPERERVVAESPDRAERRAAATEISQILRQAETLSA